MKNNIQRVSRIPLLSSLIICTLAMFNMNSAFATAGVAVNFSGFVQSMSDPGGALNGVIAEGDVVSSDFQITTNSTGNCPWDHSVDGDAICYENTATLSAALTVGSTVFNDIQWILNYALSGYYAGDYYSEVHLDGSALASGLGSVALKLQVLEYYNRLSVVDWPAAEDVHYLLSETPYIGCVAAGCLFYGWSNGGTSLLITGEQYEIEIFLTDFDLHVTSANIPVAIDIKPRDKKNCFNINGNGAVPVAIFGSETFDVSLIDQNSLSFGGLDVRVRGNKGPSCSVDYSNKDAYLDLVCQFEDDANNWVAGNGEATLTGNLIDGSGFEGTDSICIKK